MKYLYIILSFVIGFLIPFLSFFISLHVSSGWNNLVIESKLNYFDLSGAFFIVLLILSILFGTIFFKYKRQSFKGYLIGYGVGVIIFAYGIYEMSTLFVGM